MALRFRGVGDLTVGTAILGSKVRCVKLPDMSFYDQHFKWQAFDLPTLLGIYCIRANTQQGILLAEIQNPQVRHLMKAWEPTFPHVLFARLT